MATFLFPNDKAAPDTTYRTQLGGEEYLLRLRYNSRCSRWYIELYDAANNLVRGGNKLLTDWLLWSSILQLSGFPNALLIPQTLAPSEEPPEINELGEGERVELSVFQDA